MLFKKRIVIKESHSTEKLAPPTFAFGKGRVIGLYEHTPFELRTKSGDHGAFGQEIAKLSCVKKWHKMCTIPPKKSCSKSGPYI